MNKEKQQMAMLGGLLVIIIGVAVYSNWERFIPQSTGSEITVESAKRHVLPPEKAYDKLFESVTFKSLKAFADVPVAPGKIGSETLFEEFEE